MSESIPGDDTPDEFERISPVAPRGAKPEPPQPSAPSKLSAAVAFGLLLLLLVVGVGLLQLAAWRGERISQAPPTPRSTQAAATPQPTPPRSEPWKDPQILAARQAAQDAQQRFDSAVEKLASTDVASWADDNWRRALGQGESASAHFMDREYNAARDGWTAASSGLDKLLERHAQREREAAEAKRRKAFNLALGIALTALDAGQLAQAGQALTTARSLYPKDPALGDAQLRLSNAQLRRRIEALRTEAARLEAGEDWTAAADVYESILKLDGSLAFARHGLELTRRNEELAQQMAQVLANPLSLQSNSQLEAARLLLARARENHMPGPRLTADTEQLARIIANARRPLPVRLASDNATAVRIYRIGDLKPFSAQRVELIPGRYTAVGTRPGFRDVRVEFTVEPGSANGPVQISCTEAL